MAQISNNTQPRVIESALEFASMWENFMDTRSIMKKLEDIFNNASKYSVKDNVDILKNLCIKLKERDDFVFLVWDSKEWVALLTRELAPNIRRHKYWINAFSNINTLPIYQKYSDTDFPNFFVVRESQRINIQIKQFPVAPYLDRQLDRYIEGASVFEFVSSG